MLSEHDENRQPTTTTIKPTREVNWSYVNKGHCNSKFIAPWYRAVFILLIIGRANANQVNVNCYSNGDGTNSCQRVGDGEMFVCTPSIGSVSTCRSLELARGLDTPITCTKGSSGVHTCVGSSQKQSNTSFFD